MRLVADDHDRLALLFDSRQHVLDRIRANRQSMHVTVIAHDNDGRRPRLPRRGLCEPDSFRLYFAPLRRRPQNPGDPALFVPPKAVTRTLHFSHSPKSAALRWLGQEGSLGAERFASTMDAHCRVARPRRRSASGEKGNFSFFLF
jgi:hypothetical protein